MRPCDQCGAPVENDILKCTRCYGSGTAASADVVASRQSIGERNSSTEQRSDRRFFMIGYATTVILGVLLCCQLSSYMQWPMPFAVFCGVVLAFLLVGAAR